ncbi:3-keto-5-aminohexanoate cleavage protein [Pseudovibrio sp. SPO723]|uniref:3-keto-5-aminohexanoate cleavage protein n=1 Tax=Nesiotobacter zosterae TaxID=392721 RepID=UPI0029C43B29|nr:3-keto-5-aminohexanoate cleavage protein [Pseudovibrio sp. SPO723]MDX5592804.1 3-keto-5-aminohexanoate cleavage protein [Pseudovibrio sp. SPO723]
MSNVRLIMCAPNGAQRTKEDHPAIPMNIAESIAASQEAVAAGAQAIHLHVRDEEGRHTLDGARYAELLQEFKLQLPDTVCQITTEAAGVFSPQQQAAAVEQAMPEAVSVALSEMARDLAVAVRFYGFAREAGIALQHILYSPADLQSLLRLQQENIVPSGFGTCLFVLGRYSTGQQSRPQDLLSFFHAKKEGGLTEGAKPFMLCAFGQAETACLAASFTMGGNARVGFENSLWHADGRIAKNNAERVAAVADIRQKLGFSDPKDREQVLSMLGKD